MTNPRFTDDTPTIEWVGFSEDTIRQFNGIVTFEIGFTDGDGDLGRDNDTTSHIIIVDTRRTPNDTLFYQIPTIEPQGRGEWYFWADRCNDVSALLHQPEQSFNSLSGCCLIFTILLSSKFVSKTLPVVGRTK